MNKRILTILIAVIAVIGLILFAMVMSADPEDTAAIYSASSTIVTYSLVLFIATVAIALIASILGVAKNPAALKKTLLGVVTLAVIILVSYLAADDSEVLNANNKILATAKSAVSKLTSTGIWGSMILLVIGGAFFVIDLFKGLIK